MGYMTQNDGDEHWRKPAINNIKINTDAATFEESNCFSFAFIVRDHEGQLIVPKSSCKMGSIKPDLAESLSIREALVK